MERVQLKKDIKADIKGLIQQAKAEKMSLGGFLQKESPHADDENSPISALGDCLYDAGVYLRNDRKNGITATRLKDIVVDETKVQLFAAATYQVVLNTFEGYMERAERLAQAFDIADHDPGSSFRPYAQAPLRTDRPIVFPSLESVVASVDVQESDVIQIPELVPFNDSVGEGPYSWEPGETPTTRKLQVLESTKQTRWLTDGINLSEGQLSGPFGAQMVMNDARNVGIKFGKAMAKDALEDMLADSPTQVTSNMSSPNEGTLVSVSTAFNDVDQDYQVTTMVGQLPTVRAYLRASRQNATYQSAVRTPQGEVIGTEMYGKDTRPRTIYDTRIVTVPTNQMLGFDAAEGADVYVAAGSEQSLNVTKELEGVRYFSYRIKFAARKRRPSSPANTRAIRLFT